MKKQLIILFVFYISASTWGQEEVDSIVIFKKRVLDNIEVSFLNSYYTQDGDNAAVTGGIGTEKLSDITPTIVVSIPLSGDDVLTIDAGVSAYTSASSSNLDPFDMSTGASGGSGDDDDDDDPPPGGFTGPVTGSPWVESSGASRADVWSNVSLSYSHSSDDRNTILSGHGSFSSEYDYTSIGFGAGLTRLFNKKNTELGFKTNVYLDSWSPYYPTELDSYLEAGQDLNNGFFNGVDILNQNGEITEKNGPDTWSPHMTTLINDQKRNTYSASLSFSQIISKNAQFSIFLDVIKQDGWLANPMQRVYFADRPNYYIGTASDIVHYESAQNTEVFQLADDIERLPTTRLKTPIGARFNYYVSERIVLRTYYRYYRDDWGVHGHTAQIEVPVKVSDKFTIIPTYRYYNQSAADYFAPFEGHQSSSTYYTSDYDLSKFNANQYGLGISYTDIFSGIHLGKFGLKSVDVRYNRYDRSTGLTANIISAGVKFVIE